MAKPSCIMKLFTGCYCKISVLVARFTSILGIYTKVIVSVMVVMNAEGESRMQPVLSSAQALLTPDLELAIGKVIPLSVKTKKALSAHWLIVNHFILSLLSSMARVPLSWLIRPLKCWRQYRTRSILLLTIMA
jgi:hypothetical protein